MLMFFVCDPSLATARVKIDPLPPCGKRVGSGWLRQVVPLGRVKPDVTVAEHHVRVALLARRIAAVTRGRRVVPPTPTFVRIDANFRVRGIFERNADLETVADHWHGRRRPDP